MINATLRNAAVPRLNAAKSELMTLNWVLFGLPESDESVMLAQQVALINREIVRVLDAITQPPAYTPEYDSDGELITRPDFDQVEDDES